MSSTANTTLGSTGKYQVVAWVSTGVGQPSELPDKPSGMSIGCIRTTQEKNK